MVLIIHHLQRSQSERIPWLCEELGIPYELKLYKRSPFLSPPDLAALSPLKAAPVLDDTSTSSTNPLRLAESGAIIEYIIHKYGDGRLALPPSHKDYADYLYWFHLSNGNLQPVMGRSMMGQRSGADQNGPFVKSLDERLYRMLEHVDQRLQQVPWLAGEEFTAADIMSVFSLTTMRLFVTVDLSPYKGILAWLKRVGERPAYQKAMEKGDPGFEPCLQGPSPPLFTGNH